MYVDAAQLRAGTAQPLRRVRARRPVSRRAGVVRTRVAPGREARGDRSSDPDRNLYEPQTDSYAATDSAIALLVEIIHHRRKYGDTHGDVESVFTREELVTNVMLYWVTETWGSAKRFYWYTARDPLRARARARTAGAGSDRHRDVPRRGVLRAEEVHRARREPRALEPTACGWSLRGVRAARLLHRRRPGLRPQGSALTSMTDGTTDEPRFGVVSYVFHTGGLVADLAADAVSARDAGVDGLSVDADELLRLGPRAAGRWSPMPDSACRASWRSDPRSRPARPDRSTPSSRCSMPRRPSARPACWRSPARAATSRRARPTRAAGRGSSGWRHARSISTSR